MRWKRVRTLKKAEKRRGPVAYWMSRDQRVEDNWALLFSQHLALEAKVPLLVTFCLVPRFLGATVRQYSFMIRGLQEVEQNLRRKNIHFLLLSGFPEKEIPRFVKDHKVGALVTDFDPLRIKKSWKDEVAKKITIPFYEVDAHNIVPCWVASPKQEYGAYTMRPKIQRALGEFLEDFPKLQVQRSFPTKEFLETDWVKSVRGVEVDATAPEVSWIRSGEKSAVKALRYFLKMRLPDYARLRNDPVENGQSDLSPYLHFGQLSAQRVALEVQQASAPYDAREAFLEELIVRRELADNFCFYNSNYDSFAAFPPWAQSTLNEHRLDEREHLYSLEGFEKAQTHDELWNTAQMEMVGRGKMHGYLRMYWGKKIMEWTQSPEKAMEVAVYLNDKYELDGRDPNGYEGIAWSIGGVHDRPWGERRIFGKIRYMSYRGMKGKFNVGAYVNKVMKEVEEERK
jgi:deoxyribodipyrimidine photo-lyase